MPLFNNPQEIAFTPSWTNITVGSSTNTGTYIRDGNLIIFYAKLVSAASFVMSTPPRLVLPVTAAAAIKPAQMTVWMLDAGTNYHPGAVSANMSTTSSGDLCAINAASTYALLTTITSTIPFTWGTGGDEIHVSGWYWAA